MMLQTLNMPEKRAVTPLSFLGGLVGSVGSLWVLVSFRGGFDWVGYVYGAILLVGFVSIVSLWESKKTNADVTTCSYTNTVFILIVFSILALM